MAITFSFLSLLKSAYGSMVLRPSEVEAVWTQMDVNKDGSVSMPELVSWLEQHQQLGDEILSFTASSIFVDQFVGRSVPGAYRCSVESVERADGQLRLRFVTRGPKEGEASRLGPVQPAEASTLTGNGQAAKLLRANIDEQTDTLVVGELLYALPKQSKEEELVFTYGTRGYNPVVIIPAAKADAATLAKRLMDYADRDRDGTINRQEFDRLLEGLDYVATATVAEHLFRNAGVGSM